MQTVVVRETATHTVLVGGEKTVAVVADEVVQVVTVGTQGPRGPSADEMVQADPVAYYVLSKS